MQITTSHPRARARSIADRTRGDTVLDARESQSGAAFRQMVARVCGGVTDALKNGASESDVDNLLGIGFERELILEVQKRQPTVGSTAVGLFLNVIPYGSILSGAKDLYALANDGESWFGVIGMK